MPRTTNTSCFFISIIFLWDLKALEALVSENFGSWLGTRKIIWKSGKGAAFPEYSSLSLSIAPTRLLLLSHPAPSANCPSKPNYPLTNRVQSQVIALTITIILSITIYATGLRPFRCDYIPSIAVIAPKASAEGACILAEMGYCYGVWLVTFMKCGCKSGASW